MALSNNYAVLGLGRYGFTVAKELADNGAEVIAVDVDEDVVNSSVKEIPYCKCADVTNIEVLKQLGIANVDVVIIAMAGSFESSIMATMLCKELGVKTVIVKSSDETKKKILLKVGADKVVIPEQETGVRTARNLVSSGFVDVIELSRDFAMIEYDPKPEWVGKTLAELDLRKKYSINVCAIIKGGVVNVKLRPDTVVEQDVKLIIIANIASLAKI